MDKRLDLSGYIRPMLTRLEDSIIFGLFERARFKVNDKIYVVDGIPINEGSPSNVSDYSGLLTGGDIKISFLDFLLRGTEELHAKAGRYLHSEEHPFFANLPRALVVRKYGESPVKITGINLNDKIKEEYLKAVRQFCEPGDDSHYGSSAVCDIRCLQDISRRVHFGVLVAESKFQSAPSRYRNLILMQEAEKLEKEITDSKVENDVLSRVRQKGERYGANPEFIVNFYRDKIIPLTKEVEVIHLLRRGAE